MSGIAFQNVAGLKPGRTRFDWHTSTKFDFHMGQLIPMFCKKCVPGDWWSIDHDILIRCTPLIAPVMHEVTIDTHYFFIPERLLDDCNSQPGTGNEKGDPILLGTNPPPANRFNWELFITGGFDGNDTQLIPKWNPSNNTNDLDNLYWRSHAPYKYSLWDYLGLPVLKKSQSWASPLLPQDSPRRAYYYIFNQYYRDETLQPVYLWSNEVILYRSWRKDYFTSALPFQQRGIAPAFPVSGNLNAIFNIDTSYNNFAGGSTNQFYTMRPYPDATTGVLAVPQVTSSFPNSPDINAILSNNNNINIANAITFDVADLRNIVQLQKYLERNARAGVRLNEFIKAHFNESLRDERINRPEYIGGTKQPLVISEVLQTSETNTTPQGNMAGHGISAVGDHVGSYKVVEHGWIMGIISVMPVPTYQQGINRTWLAETKLDFFTPEFVNLSEQGIKQGEIYIANNSTDEALFGYQGMYDEYRTQNSEVHGSFRDTLNYWHLGRIFSSAPTLSAQFIQCDPRETLRIFADQTVPGLLCDIEHYITAVRPMPEIAEPGLLDHH